MNNDIKLVRLVIGEVLMGKMKRTENNDVELKNPLLLSFGQDARGQLMINMMEYMPFSTDTVFEFKDRDILCIASPNEKLKAQWTAKYSGVIMPNSNLIK